MKKIECMNDLEEYGFNVLTGEACNLGCRVLVDLDRQALRIYCTAYGLKHPTKGELKEGKTNFRNGYNDGIASIMLGKGIFDCTALLGMFAFWCDDEIKIIVTARVISENSRLIIYGLREEEGIRNNGSYAFPEVDKEYETESDRLEYASSWVDNWIFKANINGKWKAWPSANMGLIVDTINKKESKERKKWKE